LPSFIHECFSGFGGSQIGLFGKQNWSLWNDIWTI
jgi:hypothetical protein